MSDATQGLTEMSLDRLRRQLAMAHLDTPEYDALLAEIERRKEQGDDPAATRRQEIRDSYADEIEAARAEIDRIQDERPEQGCDLEEYRAWERRLIRARERLNAIASEIQQQIRDEGVAMERGQDERDQPADYI